MVSHVSFFSYKLVKFKLGIFIMVGHIADGLFSLLFLYFNRGKQNYCPTCTIQYSTCVKVTSVKFKDKQICVSIE